MFSAKGYHLCLSLKFRAADKIVNYRHGLDETDNVLQSQLHLGDMFLLRDGVYARIIALRHKPVTDEQAFPAIFVESLVVVQRNAPACRKDVELALEGFGTSCVTATIP